MPAEHLASPALVLTQKNWGLGADGQVEGSSLPSPNHPTITTQHAHACLQIAVTFAIVLGVIIYRISTAAALAMNSSPSVRSNIRVTVTATAVIINLVVIILLDEVYGCIARWLTKIGEYCVQDGMSGIALVAASLEEGSLATDWVLTSPACPWPALSVSG